MKNEITEIELNAAMRTVAMKLQNSGMTLEQAIEYVKANREQVGQWAVKLILSNKDRI